MGTPICGLTVSLFVFTSTAQGARQWRRRGSTLATCPKSVRSDRQLNSFGAAFTAMFLDFTLGDSVVIF